MITCDSILPLQYQVPFRCAEATIDQLPQPLHSNVLTEVMQRRGAVLFGPVGTGKTYAMCAARRLVGMWPNGSLFVDWPEFITDIERFRDNHTSDREKFNPERNLFWWRGPLFIDDVGAEQMISSGYKQGNSEAVFDQFVNRRTGMEYPLWITTNLEPQELRTRYGERTISRLVEHCAFLRVGGSDRRLAS